MNDLIKTPATPATPDPVRAIRGNRQKRLLSESIILEEEVLPTFVRIALLAVAALVSGFIVWAAVVDIEEVAVATGEIVPSGSVRIVQHLEGGVVADVLVTEGQMVSEGDVIIRLAPPRAQADLEQSRARMTALLLRAERLTALTEGREPDFSGIGEGLDHLRADQQAIYGRQMTARQTSAAVLQSQIDQRQREVSQLRDSLRVAEGHQRVTSELLEMRARLVERGLISRVVYMETERAKLTAAGEVDRLREQIGVATNALAESRSRLQDLDAQTQRDAAAELGDVTAELEQVRNAVARAQDAFDRLDIRAPVGGLVQDLRVRTPGEVIAPAGLVARVVPVSEVLEADVRISPRDIGHLRAGQPTLVKVSSYDYSRYGGLPGTLIRLSPSSFLDAGDDEPHYRGVIALERPYIGPGVGQFPVMPGMTITADIKTGDKTLLQYLLKPVVDTVNRSFRER